ncbi:hypothetical protein GUF49_14750, partial [Xanthomonas citri pv. citri]|nr:hypothetical protein [Xanthomonas citri pv. citri]
VKLANVLAGDEYKEARATMLCETKGLTDTVLAKLQAYQDDAVELPAVLNLDDGGGGDELVGVAAPAANTTTPTTTTTTINAPAKKATSFSS